MRLTGSRADRTLTEAPLRKPRCVFERRAEPAHTIVPERQLVKKRLPLGQPGSGVARCRTGTKPGATTCPSLRRDVGLAPCFRRRGPRSARALFLHGSFGRRKCLEALVWDRLATFDGE